MLLIFIVPHKKFEALRIGWRSFSMAIIFCDKYIASKINVTPKFVRLSEKLQHLVMKLDTSNKFALSYYGQVNSVRLKSSVASIWASKHLWDNIYFAGFGTSRVSVGLAICQYCADVWSNTVFALRFLRKGGNLFIAEPNACCILLQKPHRKPFFQTIVTMIEKENM